MQIAPDMEGPSVKPFPLRAPFLVVDLIDSWFIFLKGLELWIDEAASTTHHPDMRGLPRRAEPP